MSKARVIVLSVVHQGMSKAEAARKFNVSWRWVHTVGGAGQQESGVVVEPVEDFGVVAVREWPVGEVALPGLVGHHLGVGREHAHKPALILITENNVTITDRNTGEILGTHLIEPDKNYWRNQTKEPGRWPGPSL